MPRRINIIVPSLTFSSFSYVGKILKAFLLSTTNNFFNPNDIMINTFYVYGALNVRIDDAFLCMVEARYCDIAWIDTALNIPATNVRSPARIITCSKWDREKIEKLGLKVDGVIPRLVNPLIFKFKPCDWRYDFFVCGWYREPDRKNFKYVDYVREKFNPKILGITNYNGKFTDKYDFGSLTDNEKFNLMCKSKFCLFLSGAEGFGMPIYEAMSMGIPAVFLDAPAHNEFAVGLKVKAEDKMRVKYWLGQYLVSMDIYTPNLKSLEEEVKYAMEMGKEEYHDLSCKSIEKSREMISETLEWIYKNLIY